MTADVIKRAQNAIVPADYYDGFSGHSCAYELAGGFYLIGARYQLPGFAEDIQALDFGYAGVGVPCGGNREGLR
jgi:hypothetical protein